MLTMKLKSLSRRDTTRLNKIDNLIVVCIFGMILAGLAFLASVNHKSVSSTHIGRQV